MHFTELRYQDPATKTYLGSPSLVRLANGDMLATHDYFGPGCPRNHEDEEHLTSVYRSCDGGATWNNITHIANAYWSTLFVLGDVVYLLGTSQQYGSIVIRRSIDNGNTWTHPASATSGVLFKGGVRHAPPNYHCAPVPVWIRDGRLYRAFEDNTPLDWPTGFQACIISADVGADLLNAANWTMSEKLPFNQAWLPAEWGTLTKAGWLEGNVVEDCEGQLWNILRFNAQVVEGASRSVWNKAAMVKIENDGRRLSFDPATGFIDLPGGHTKFTIRYDAQTSRYLTLSNGVADISRSTNRSVLSVCTSRDLRTWEHCTVLLADDQRLPSEVSAQQTGFQYVDWHFDGDDLIYLVRTAYDSAHNFHDANRITFHRLALFRKAVK
ncbi:MAG: exo-alpha-sialidase [Anaerolineae bacterium]|nr:exo-alpha-sialidase [Anaerolineae bacterium]